VSIRFSAEPILMAASTSSMIDEPATGIARPERSRALF
jgi:hypothetical protein